MTIKELRDFIFEDYYIQKLATKHFKNPNITDMKSAVIEHPQVFHKISKNYKAGWKGFPSKRC